MKKVLIITYYWPPMGGGGVQRWLKFVKYLRDLGREPVIFTTDGGQGGMRDHSLMDEVPKGIETIRRPIFEPYRVYNLLLGKRKEEGAHPGFVDTEGKRGREWLKRIGMWTRGALFIPDARMFWIRPSARALIRILRNRDDIDLILSTGPPHSTHLIAEKVKRKLGCQWIADFRDPWTDIDYFHKLPIPLWAKKRHRALEKKVLIRADRVVTVSWSWAKDLEKLGGREVEVVPNGFDPADFAGVEPRPTRRFSITHAGSFNEDRNPLRLWEAMKELAEEEEGFGEDLLVRSIGPTDHSVLRSIEKNSLGKNFQVINELPHHEVIAYLMNSWVLLLPLNDSPNIDGVVPGKLYEYMGAERPVLCTGKRNGDAAWIIEQTSIGKVLDLQDKEGMKTVLRSYYQAYKRGELNVEPTGAEAYSRKNLAGEYTRIMDELS